MTNTVDPSKILFYVEKKAVIVNILDTAVKTLEFDQKSYMEVKSLLMRTIEKAGNERIGLNKIVELTNKTISKIAHNSGYVIVENAEEGPAEKSQPEAEVANDPPPKKKHPAANRNPASEQERNFHQASVALQERKVPSKTRTPNVKGKEELLRLMNFLPPLISRQEIEMLSARVKAANVGPATGSSPARTTGDLEREMVNQARQEYSHVFRGLIKNKPKAFIETIEMASGRTREEDISDKLRTQLTRVNSIAEFLSVRDLVDRQVKSYELKHRKKEKADNSLFFWRKK